ncbi:MAG: hypothetical protein B6I31_00060 [Desulfobacteraceae bacterium 4572_19]|nr:MAG: hypothetical protein B6I31_00060 [Desulfobacteraceae bacterium 4572_19]
MNSIKLLSNEVVFGKGTTAQFQYYVNGVATTPTSGKITLYNPDNVIVFENETMTINGSLIEYDLTAEHLSLLDENYRIIVEHIYNGQTYVSNFLLDVVLTPLVLSLTSSDLLDRHPTLNYDLWEGVTTYSVQIQKAFELIKKDIKNKGNRPSMIIDAHQIENIIELKTLELIYFDFATDNEGINWERYLKYKEQYAIELSNLVIKYDANEDGQVDSVVNFSTVRLRR